MKFKSLNQAYDDAIKRIDQQEPEDKELAWRAFAWIAHAIRTLSPGELCHILSLESESNHIRNEDIYDIEDIVSVCAGLVTIDQGMETVRFIHYTTHQYFDGLQWKNDTKVDVALDCVTYLSLEPFRSGGPVSARVLRQRLEENAFLVYAACYWSDHVRPVQTEILNSTITFLCNNDLMEFTCQAALTPVDAGRAMIRYSSSPQVAHYVQNRHGLHLTARHGLEDLAKVLIDKYSNSKDVIDSADSMGQTPLSLAVRFGHYGIVKLLIDTDKVDVNSIDKTWRTPLVHATENGRLEIVNLLIRKKARVEWTDIYPDMSHPRATPLWHAAHQGHETIVQRLIDSHASARVDIEAKNEDGKTALAAASTRGHVAVMKMLIDSGNANAESRSTNCATPLHHAASGEHESAINMLLDVGVDPDPKDKHSETPLLIAARNGHETAVKALLDTGKVDPNARNNVGDVPLSLAARNGHYSTVKRLLGNSQVDPDIADNTGQTALWKAADNGHEDVVKLLLDPALLDNGKVNPDSRDRLGRTPLWQATYNQHQDIVGLLVDKRLLDSGKVDPNSKPLCDKIAWELSEKTPLELAADRNNEPIRELLLDTGRVDPDEQGASLQVPPTLAVETEPVSLRKPPPKRRKFDTTLKNANEETSQGQATPDCHESIFQRLLSTEEGDSHLKDANKRTSLGQAVQNRDEGMVDQLLSIGKLDPNSRDANGLTPLQHAVGSQNEAILKLLLAYGELDPDLKDVNEETPLQQAVQRRDEVAVKLLLASSKVDPDSKDVHGQTPLQEAVRNRDEGMIKMLLNTGRVDPKSPNKYGLTPLARADSSGLSAIVGLLESSLKIV